MAFLPTELVHHVLRFAGRREREILGYNVEKCIRHQIPPVPIRQSWFHPYLADLHLRRASPHGVYNYYHGLRIHTLFFVDDGHRVLMQIVERPYLPNVWAAVRTAFYDADADDGLVYEMVENEQPHTLG